MRTILISVILFYRLPAFACMLELGDLPVEIENGDLDIETQTALRKYLWEETKDGWKVNVNVDLGLTASFQGDSLTLNLSNVDVTQPIDMIRVAIATVHVALSRDPSIEVEYRIFESPRSITLKGGEKAGTKWKTTERLNALMSAYDIHPFYKDDYYDDFMKLNDLYREEYMALLEESKIENPYEANTIFPPLDNSTAKIGKIYKDYPALLQYGDALSIENFSPPLMRLKLMHSELFYRELVIRIDEDEVKVMYRLEARVDEDARMVEGFTEHSRTTFANLLTIYRGFFRDKVEQVKNSFPNMQHVSEGPNVGFTIPKVDFNKLVTESSGLRSFIGVN